MSVTRQISIAAARDTSSADHFHDQTAVGCALQNKGQRKGFMAPPKLGGHLIVFGPRYTMDDDVNHPRQRQRAATPPSRAASPATRTTTSACSTNGAWNARPMHLDQPPTSTNSSRNCTPSTAVTCAIRASSLAERQIDARASPTSMDGRPLARQRHCLPLPQPRL